MIKDQIIDGILKTLENKLNLTELEKDILDSIKDLKKLPVDRNALIKRIKENKAKYDDMMLKTFALLTIQSRELPVYKLYDEFSNEELQNYLITQIKILFTKS